MKIISLNIQVTIKRHKKLTFRLINRDSLKSRSTTKATLFVTKNYLFPICSVIPLISALNLVHPWLQYVHFCIVLLFIRIMLLLCEFFFVSWKIPFLYSCIWENQYRFSTVLFAVCMEIENRKFCKLICGNDWLVLIPSLSQVLVFLGKV